eukprot:9321930-Pyramimonas_sp.AAC.1
MEVTHCKGRGQNGQRPRECPNPPVDKSKRRGPKEKRMLHGCAFTGVAIAAGPVSPSRPASRSRPWCARRRR